MHAAYTETLHELQNLAYFSKVAHIRLQTFAIELSLVSLRVRSGYLFDAFSLYGQAREPAYILADTIRHLRRRISEYCDVAVVHDTTHDQFFVVNTPLLTERCQTELGIGPDSEPCSTDSQVLPYTIFVLLDDVPRVLHDVPVGVRTQLTILLSTIRTNTRSAYLSELLTISSSHEASMQDLVPAAAVILEYAVAYVPESHEQSTFLPWEVLDVYECVLKTRDTREGHVMCKFSCPSSLAHHAALQITSLQQTLKDRFTARLVSAQVQGTIEIRHHQEMHERVAL